MLFTLQGSPIRILDEHQNDPGGAGGGSEADTGVAAENIPDKTTPDGGKPGEEGAKDVSAQTPPSTETPTSEPAAEPKPSAKDTEDAEAKTKASAKVASENRTLKQENEGLRDRNETLQEVEKRAAKLDAENAAKDEIIVNLELASKWGFDPKMLEPINGTREEKEEWIRTFTAAPEKSGAATDPSNPEPPATAPRVAADPDKKPAEYSEGEPESQRVVTREIDAGRPKSSDTKEFVDTKQMSTKEARKYLEDKI